MEILLLVSIMVFTVIAAIGLTIIEFMLLRGVCKLLARILVNSFGSDLEEKGKTELRSLVSIIISIMIFIVIVLITWKLIILLLVSNTLLPVAVLKAIF